MVEKYSIPVEKEVCQLEGNIDNQEFFETLLRMVDVITAEIEDKRQGPQKYSAVKIMNYIKEHYCDSELSVKQISCVLGYHEKYISNLFKETYHECLSAVIERLRIEKACDLLKNSNGKITDITEAVGYTSDVSFRRAFKKITGVSPSEYRERI